jgi:hypothetical protein
MMEANYSLMKMWARTQSNQGILFYHRGPDDFLLHELRLIQNLHGIAFSIAFVNSIDDLLDPLTMCYSFSSRFGAYRCQRSPGEFIPKFEVG